MGDVDRFLWVGGHVAVDFVNTLGGRPDEPDDEYLYRYEDLLLWTESAQLLPHSAARHLRSEADRNPIGAEAALQEARRLRESLDRLLRSALPGREVPRLAADVGTVHHAYLDAVASASPQPDTLRLVWDWPDDSLDLRRPVWPVAFAVVDLLEKAPLDRLGRCEHCQWLFLDASPQRNRRWCSMNACGAITKMRRYRTTHRTATPR